MALCITRIPRTRVDWTVSGACISGSIARRADATRRTSGGSVMTSTPTWHGSRNGIASPPSSRDVRFLAVSTLLFAVSIAITIVSCASMTRMGEMPMAGGWTMSMVWTRMPQQTWVGAAASFLGMWIVMMVAMMLPSLVPTLWRYRRAVRSTGETRLGLLTVLVGVG